MKRRTYLILLTLLALLGARTTSSATHKHDGKNAVTVDFGRGRLQLTPLTERAVRIQYREGAAARLYSDASTDGDTLPEWVYVGTPRVRFRTSRRRGTFVLRTRQMALIVSPSEGCVAALDARGDTVFRATEHSLRPQVVADVPTHEATLTLQSLPSERLYGMGQFQDGYTDIRGLSRRLTQVNTQIAIPMMLSSRGYGLLWNNYGLTELNPCSGHVDLIRTDMTGETETVNVTSTEGGRQEVRRSNLFRATLDVPTTGRYALLLDVGQTMTRRHHLVIDGDTLADFRNLWLPPTASLLANLTAGRHEVEAELEHHDRPRLYIREVTDETRLRSPMAEAVDYTLFVGKADEVVAAYREATGAAPLMPRWALGYIHCRERFHSQDELLATAHRFRRDSLPLDLIVQDWQYWGRNGWNSMQFDRADYPDPRRMTDSLHAMHMRMMLSVWSRIDRRSPLGHEMDSLGHYIPGTDWVDFFSPKAARAYWDNFERRLLRPYGIDAWWQDATEPENDDLVGRRVGGGRWPGERVRNIYPLLVNKTVYEGCLAAQPRRRPMILTRSGFPGIQRYGVALWTGDVGNDWETLRRQVCAGLGTMASGMPWWTYDAGGFFRPHDQYDNADYQRRMVRWIQLSVFLPLMRVHGYMSDTEPWRYAPDTQRRYARCLRERYRLLPYIYSHAAEVHFQGGTLMRPLVFDFPDDPEALSQPLEYMFGRALLVCPVVNGEGREAEGEGMRVYLPKTDGGWTDFYTGEHHEGGQYLTLHPSPDHLPVFVRAGSIVPIGPDRQHTDERPDAPIELHVYPGRDADFTLYDDDGTTTDYTQGHYTRLHLHWDDCRHRLTLKQDTKRHDRYELENTTDSPGDHLVYVLRHVGSGR